MSKLSDRLRNCLLERTSHATPKLSQSAGLLWDLRRGRIRTEC